MMIIPVTSRIQKIIRILFCHCCIVTVFIIVPDNLDENGYEKYQEKEYNSNHSYVAYLFFFSHD